MNEIKFACPVCGQHITCDDAKIGTHMACPTCYRELVIPQASAGGGKLILSAAEVQTRPAPTNPVDILPTPMGGKRSKAPGILLVVFLLTVGAAAYVFRDKLLRPPASANGAEAPAPVASVAAPVPTLKRAPSDADSQWTQDMATIRMADSPASGRVHGYSFALDRATITGGTLNLRQGPNWPPDLGVTVYLFAERGEDLAGKTVAIDPVRTESPKVTLRWKDEQGQAATETLRAGYALRLEFGAVTGKTLAGKLYLATADGEKSFVSGTFAAEIRKPSPPKK